MTFSLSVLLAFWVATGPVSGQDLHSSSNHESRSPLETSITACSVKSRYADHLDISSSLTPLSVFLSMESFAYFTHFLRNETTRFLRSSMLMSSNLQSFNQRLYVSLSPHSVTRPYDSSVCLNCKGRPQSPHVRLSVHVLLPPSAILLVKRSLLVQNQVKWQLMLVDELLVRLCAVSRDSDDFPTTSLESTETVSEVTGL